MSKFLVLKCWRYTTGDKWEVIAESRKGCTFQEAERIKNYHLEMKQCNPENIRIVEIKDGFMEIVNEQNP